MYSITNKFDNAFDLLSYVISAMTDSGYMPCDIDEFLFSAVGNGNYNLLTKSTEILAECNKVVKEDNLYNDIYANNWRDHYYGSDEEFLFDSIDDYTDCDYNLELDPNYFTDEDEAYEGFKSCPNHQYNAFNDCTYSIDDDTDDYPITNWFK